MIDIDRLRHSLASATPTPARPRESNIGVIRALYSEICKKRESGWRVADLVKWLADNGVALSENCFRNYLCQIARERNASSGSGDELDGEVGSDKSGNQSDSAVGTAEALRALAQGAESRSKIGRLRGIYDEIENAQRAGVSNSRIVETLNGQGFDLTLKTFGTMLYRIRQERITQGE